jgi:uncharacterized protein YdhG (YjbR/CyaY superfamily)
MKANQPQPENIDEYIAGYPESVQHVLEQVRAVIKGAAPDAQEAIKYRLPTFVLHGNLVHFGAFKNHIGFYPTPSGIEEFKKDLLAFASAKGSVQFPLDKPMPLRLIAKIVKFRVAQTRAKVAGAKLRSPGTRR